jgi:ABC-type uncharacterized transport system permease subunit
MPDGQLPSQLEAPIGRPLGWLRGAAWRPTLLWLVVVVAGVLLSLALIAPFVALAGADVFQGYQVLLAQSVGTSYGLTSTLLEATPLIPVSVGVAIAYRAGLFNVGGEGQLLWGALAAVLVGLNVRGVASLPGSYLLPLLVGVVAGGVWGGIAGYLKAWRGINEIVSTIMLNFVALYAVQALVSGPLRDPHLDYNATPEVLPGYRLPILEVGPAIQLGLPISIVVAVVLGCYSEFSRHGIRLRLVGMDSRLAARQGVSPRFQWVLALWLAGALAGLGGAVEALGNQYRVGENFSPGWGFAAIAIALLARGNLFAVIPVTAYFAALEAGTSGMGRVLAVPGGIVFVIQALPLIMVAAIIGINGMRRKAAL